MDNLWGLGFKNVNSTSPTFNVNQYGNVERQSPHKHTITDFKMTGSPTKNKISDTY